MTDSNAEKTGASLSGVGSTAGSALPCESCKHMDWNLMCCHFLRHPIENGYAMRCHSVSCGGYTSNSAIDIKSPPIARTTEKE